MGVKIYYSSVSSNLEIKKNQQKLRFTLESKHIEFELIDVAASDDAKEEMRRLSGNPTALPPQIFNGTTYCGDFDAFEEAVENESIETFLKLK